VGTGDRVVWLGQNSFRCQELLLAAAKVGAMVCPVNWRQSEDELVWVLEDFDPKVIVWQAEEIEEKVISARQRYGRGLWLQHDGEGPESYEHALSAESADDPNCEVDAGQPVLVIYTAAFGGRPNGALLTHTNLLIGAVLNAYFWDIDEDYVFLNCSPMFHWATWMYIIPTLVFGGRNVSIRRMDAEDLCRVIEAERCTNAFIPPITISQINEVNANSKYDLTSMRVSFHPESWTPGMTSPNTSRTSVFGGGYGQTEVAGRCMMSAVGKGGDGFHGRTIPLTSIRLVDNAGREVPIGEIGEVVVKGFLVCSGYWNRPDLNKSRTIGGWWHTHDLARRESDGSFTFVGPKTQMIKCGEENIYPTEVEGVIVSHPAVKAAAIIGVPDEKWTQTVKAVVVLQDGESLGEQELIEYVKSRIASYKKPKSVVFVETIPMKDGGNDYSALDAAHGGGGYPGDVLY